MNRTEPWLTESANAFLKYFFANGRNLSVFEFGMGASTVWFWQQKNIRSLTSIEHDTEWFNKIMLEILKLENPIIPDVAFTKTALPYNNQINKKPDQVFDLVLVDGRNRVRCIETAIPKIAKGGVLILDNSERDYYRPGIDLMAGWERIETFQTVPDKFDFFYPGWQTTIFIKPA